MFNHYSLFFSHEIYLFHPKAQQFVRLFIKLIQNQSKFIQRKGRPNLFDYLFEEFLMLNP